MFYRNPWLDFFPISTSNKNSHVSFFLHITCIQFILSQSFYLFLNWCVQSQVNCCAGSKMIFIFKTRCKHAIKMFIAAILTPNIRSLFNLQVFKYYFYITHCCYTNTGLCSCNIIWYVPVAQWKSIALAAQKVMDSIPREHTSPTDKKMYSLNAL